MKIKKKLIYTFEIQIHYIMSLIQFTNMKGLICLTTTLMGANIGFLGAKDLYLTIDTPLLKFTIPPLYLYYCILSGYGLGKLLPYTIELFKI